VWLNNFEPALLFSHTGTALGEGTELLPVKDVNSPMDGSPADSGSGSSTGSEADEEGDGDDDVPGAAHS